MSNSLRSLYTRQVGVGPASWVDVTPTPVSPPGSDVLRVGDNARSFLRKPLEHDRLEPLISPLPKGSSFVRDDAELAFRLSQGLEFLNELKASNHNWAHLEVDQASKLTYQRGGAPAWWCSPAGYHVKEAASLAKEFQWIADTLGPATAKRPTYRQGTNHGFPDYGNSTTSFCMHAFWGATILQMPGDVVANINEQGKLLASDLGEEDTPFSAALFNRSGPLKKTVPGFSLTYAGAVHDCDLTSLCPRRRPVNGVTSAINMAQTPEVDLLTSAVYASPRRKHFGASDVSSKLRAVWRPGWVSKSDDISGFDTSVCRRHQLELSSIVYARVMTERILQLKDFGRLLPLLSPPLSLGAAAFLYTKDGTTASGDKTTAIDGTCINEARVLYCMQAATGLSLDRLAALIGTKWFYLVQGDDTVLLYEKGFVNEERYEAASLELGYKSKLQDGCVFLMHLHEPRTGAWTPLASRVLQQTWFNEYGGVDTAMEMFSWIARTPPQFWISNPWSRSVERAMADAPIFKEWGVRPSRASGLLGRPDFIAAVQDAAKRDAKVRDRFRWAFSSLDSADRPDVAHIVGTLLGADDADLPTIDYKDAFRAARKLADWMGTRRHDRAEGLPDLGSRTANDYRDFLVGKGKPSEQTARISVVA